MSTKNMNFEDVVNNYDPRIAKYTVFSEGIRRGDYDGFLEDILVDCRDRINDLSDKVKSLFEL